MCSGAYSDRRQPVDTLFATEHGKTRAHSGSLVSPGQRTASPRVACRGGRRCLVSHTEGRELWTSPCHQTRDELAHRDVCSHLKWSGIQDSPAQGTRAKLAPEKERHHRESPVQVESGNLCLPRDSTFKTRCEAKINEPSLPRKNEEELGEDCRGARVWEKLRTADKNGVQVGHNRAPGRVQALSHKHTLTFEAGRRQVIKCMG